MAKRQVGGDLSGSAFAKEPGTYHMIIQGVDDLPTKKDGTPIDNADFRVNFAILAGTVDGQQDKTGELTFFHPKATEKNGGAFTIKKADRMLLAVCMISDEDKGAEVDIDYQDMVGRQFIAKLELSQDEKYLQLSYADVYHVDDPAVAAIPKNQEALKLIEPQFRRIGNRPKTTNVRRTVQQETATAPAGGDVDYSDV